MKKIEKINQLIEQNSKYFENKKVLITGANSGIGFAFTKLLANIKGIHITLCCRNSLRANKAMDELLKINNNLSVDIFLADLSNINSVLNLKYYLLNNKYDYIYLNAGVLSNSYNEDNISITYLTNLLSNAYLSKFLTNESFKNTKVIYTSTIALKNIKKKIDINFIKNKKGDFYKYSTSKYLMTSYFYNLITYNPNFYIVHPGISDSNIFSNLPKFLLPLAHFVVKTFTNDSVLGALPYLLVNKIENNKDYMLCPKYSIKGYPKQKNIRKIIKKNYKYHIDEIDNLINEFYKER